MTGRLFSLFLVSLPLFVSSASAQSWPNTSIGSSSGGGIYPSPSLQLAPEPSPYLPPIPVNTTSWQPPSATYSPAPNYTHSYSDPYEPPPASTSSGYHPPLPPIAPNPPQPEPPAPVNPNPKVDCSKDEGVKAKVDACLGTCRATGDSVYNRCLDGRTECIPGTPCEISCYNMGQFAVGECEKRCNENIRNEAIRACECRATTDEPAAECYQACLSNPNQSNLSNCLDACASAQNELTGQCISSTEEQTTGN